MTGAIIQARMGSTRLPGKVLMPISGKPMLERVVERVRRARLIEQVVVATSDDPADDLIEQLCSKLETPCFRGNQNDVLDRYFRAASTYAIDPVLRVTADCPLIDPEVIDRILSTFLAGQHDYVANTNPPTYPDGLDAETFSFSTLEQAWRQAAWASEREHVTLYIRNHPELFRIGNIVAESDLSGLRWVVDEPQDLTFVQSVYQGFGERPFLMRDVMSFIEQHPDLNLLNAHITRDEGLQKSLQQDRMINV